MKNVHMIQQLIMESYHIAMADRDSIQIKPADAWTAKHDSNATRGTWQFPP